MEAVLTEIAGTASRGMFVALKNSFSQLGIGVATMLSGILFEASGYGAVCHLGSAFCLLAAVSMLFTFRERNL
jgi:predicted MFS family arabinose efflux permease